jgi:hypothetical protein
MATTGTTPTLITSLNTISLTQSTTITNSPFYTFKDGANTNYYLFDLAVCDASGDMTAIPTFEGYDASGGPSYSFTTITDVSAISIIDVSAANFNKLFAFWSDSYDVSDIDSALDVKYGVGNVSSCFSGIPFASSSITYTEIGARGVLPTNLLPSYYNNSYDVSKDFVVDLAAQITGGYVATTVDLFNNEQVLRDAITNKNTSIQNIYNSYITNASNCSYSSINLSTVSAASSTELKLALSTKNLVTGFLNLNTTNNVSNAERKTRFLTDLSNNKIDEVYFVDENTSYRRNRFHVTFRENDLIAVRVQYNLKTPEGASITSASSYGLGNNSLKDHRAYKVYLRMRETVIN